MTARRSILKALLGLSLVPSIASWSGRAWSAAEDLVVIWGGTGFNVQFDEIKVKLPLIRESLESNNQSNWYQWRVKASDALKKYFRGEVISSPEEKISTRGDLRLILSVGFDYENFTQLLVPEGQLGQEAKDAGLDTKDISYYYLFSSIRTYSVKLSRNGGGQVTLVYSKPIKAAGETLLLKGSVQARNKFILNTLMGERKATTLQKFAGLASELALKEADVFSPPKHLRVRSVTFSAQARNELATIKLDRVFNENLFASVAGVSVNEAFGSSVIPFVVTDYLGRTLANRFKQEQDMNEIFQNMEKSELASMFIDLNVSKVLRKISGETPSLQQIARGFAVDIGFYDVERGSEIFRTKLVRVEKREQAKGAAEEAYYRGNDSVGFYELLDTMMSSFFQGVARNDRVTLKQSGVRDKDASDNQIKALASSLEETRYGEA